MIDLNWTAKKDIQNFQSTGKMSMSGVNRGNNGI